VAATARRLGCRTHIFARSDRILGRSVSAPIAAHLQSRHESEGVRFTFGAEPLGVVPGDGGPVLVTGGEHHRFDDILVAVGSEPRDLLAVRAGIETAQGVLVDERRQTSVADVYCIGDAARLRRPTNGTPDRLESVHGANDDAKIVAAQILGNVPAAPAVPWFWSDQYDVRLQVAGFRSKSTCAVVRGAEAEDEFAVVHTAGERVVCVEAVNSAVDFAVGRRLIATGARMDLALLATAESLLDAVCEEEPE
jgi:3-phenylpropionate/trans-cinnamate dioxygenase ferredoxin reductase subunit